MEDKYISYGIIGGKPKNRNRNRLSKVIFSIISLILIILIAIPFITMHRFINIHVQYDEVYAAEDYSLFSDRIELTTEDGLSIVAHEVFIEEPKAIVIILTGIHNPSVTAFFGHSKLLYDNGFASILLEVRAHGESEGKVIGLGFKEHLDTKALVDYIKTDKKYENVPIVVFGASMGGATAINSFGLIPEIDGLISMSAYSSWEDVFTDNLINMRVPRIFASMQKPFMKVHTTVKYGLSSIKVNPKNLIKNAGERPALIMHSTGDTQVPFANFERLIKNAPSHVESWARDGDSHFVVIRDKLLTPFEDSEYSNRIINFLNKNF